MDLPLTVETQRLTAPCTDWTRSIAAHEAGGFFGVLAEHESLCLGFNGESAVGVSIAENNIDEMFNWHNGTACTH